MNRQGAKAAKGFCGWGLVGLVVAGIGLVMSSACGGKESTSQTTPGSGGGGGLGVGDAAAGQPAERATTIGRRAPGGNARWFR